MITELYSHANELTKLRKWKMKKIVVILAAVMATALFFTGCAPTNPHLTEAKISMNRDDFQKAKKELAMVLEQDPNNVEAAYLEGYVHSKEENWEKMYQSFERVKAIDPEYEKDNRDNLSLRAFGALRSTGINDKFNKAVPLITVEPEAAQKIMESALNDLELADKLKDDDFITKDIIAMIYLQLGNKEKAIEMFNDAIKNADPENDMKNMLSAYVNLSNIYTEMGDEEKSLEMLNKVLEYDPQNKEALLQIAKYHETKKDYDKALPLYDKMLELEPENVDVLFNQGIAFKSNDQLDKAIANFEKIITINPDDTETTYFLTMFYNEKEDYQKVVDLIEPRYDGFDDEFKNKVSYYMQVALVKVGRAKDASKYGAQ